MATNPLAIKKIKRTRSKRTGLKVFVVAMALLLVSGTVFGARMLTVGGGAFGSESNGFFAQLRALFGDSQPLIGENDDRVNILLLGIGGEGHDGPNLADTNVVLSLRPSTEEVAMLSLPRDLLVDIPAFGQNKLNSAFAFGEEYGQDGGGAVVATEMIEHITGLDLPYYGVVDFTGFEQIVDELGGVEVDVPEDFYDYWHGLQYYEGPNNFDGEEALMFVRARYVNGPQGGDFARARRTQLVMKALQQKALALNPVADLGKITSIMSSLGDHVRTNMQPSELRRLYELTSSVSLDQIQNKVVDDADTGLLYGTSIPIGGVNVSVLVPNDSSFNEIRQYAAAMFDPAPPEPEDAGVEILNGTETVGIAGSFGDLIDIGVPIIGVDNADREDYDDTFIVDNTDGEVPISLEMIQEALEDSGINVTVVSSTRYPNTSTAELLIVLGQDYADEFAI